MLNQKDQYEQMAQAFGIDPSTDPNFAATYNQLIAALNDDEMLGQQVLDALEDEILIRQEAQKRGISVSEAEVAEAMQEAFGFYPGGTPTAQATATLLVEPTLNSTQQALVTITVTPSPFPTATVDPSATPTATLEPTATNTAGPSPTATATETPYTEEGYEQVLAETRNNFAEQAGLNEEQFHNLFVATLLREKLSEDINAGARPVQEQVWAQHILVETEEQANAVLSRLDEGEDWSELAAELSTDTSNKDKGGDLGWFPHGMMVSEFEEAAFAAKIGDLIGPVETQFGYHIIRILGHEDRPVTDEQFQQSKEEAFQQWLEEARAAARIQVYDFWKGLTFPIGVSGG
jgi:parvulin-like peptidyl-prolyl isomerase